MELLKPFADTGEKEEFDIDTSPSGDISLEKGFTQLFELKPEEGGLFILRKKFNQLMYLMSKSDVNFNTLAFPKWIADADGLGTHYSYNKGVIVTYTDNKQYVSMTDSNTGEPTVDTANWKLADLNNYMDLVSNQDISGTKTFTSSPTAPTPTAGDNSTRIATTAFVRKGYIDIVTGTATFTNTNQNINMAGIGLLSGLEIGDVIQVSGSTSNNTEYTVEFITDADNIVVNYEHRGQTTSKSLTDETSTIGVTVKLLCKWYNAPAGLGQGWCVPTSSRSLSTVYTGLLNRDMRISAVVFNPGTDIDLSLLINGEAINQSYLVRGVSLRASVYSVIPSNDTYTVTCAMSTGTPTIESFNELR